MKLLGSAVRVCSWITCGSVTSAMTRSPPPHFGHTDKSIANMRFNRRIGGEVLLEERARHRQDVRHWHLQRICDPGGEAIRAVGQRGQECYAQLRVALQRNEKAGDACAQPVDLARHEIPMTDRTDRTDRQRHSDIRIWRHLDWGSS